MIDDYFQGIETGIHCIDVSQIERIIQLFKDANHEKKRIFMIGNGGSAATANHFTCDFGKNAARGESDRFKIISLCDNVSYITAYGNDIGYECVFVEQLKNQLESGDILVAISASGNSSNIIKAVELARNRHGIVIGLTGFDGGQLGKLADINLNIDLAAIEQIEDIHMMILHILVYCFKQMLKAG